MAGRIAYYGNIVTDGLVLNLDAARKDSYNRTGTTWNDISGNGNNGTLTNGPTFDSDNAGSINFDGTNDYISFPSSFNATTAGLNGYHSVEMWVYPNRTSNGNDGLFRCRLGGTGKYLHYIIRSNRFHLGWYSIDTGGSQVISPNNWYHVVFLFDTDDRQKIYINGSLDRAGSVLADNPNLLDGKFFNGGTASIQIGYYSTHFQGRMPSCRVYNRALSADEVQQNFNALRGRYGI